MRNRRRFWYLREITLCGPLRCTHYILRGLVVDKFQVVKFANPSLVIPAGSAGIQGQGCQKQWGFKS